MSVNLVETARVAESHNAWVVSHYTDQGRVVPSTINRSNQTDLIRASMEENSKKADKAVIETEEAIIDTRAEASDRRLDPDL